MATFQFREKNVFYDIRGDEFHPVLVMLNGIMMSTKSWDPFVAAFSDKLRLLRVDFLDQGESDRMIKPYTQAVQVDMLLALLDHLKLERVHLAGISYGGSVAMQFAAAHPGRVEKLMLFNVTAKTTPWLKAIGDGWNAVAASRDGNAYYHIAIPYIYSPGFYNQHIEWMDARKDKLVPLFSDVGFLDAMIRLTQSAESHDVASQLPLMRMPTLVVASEHDFLTPPSEQRIIARAMPHAAFVMFEDCGHASMYEKPSLFVSTILGFVYEDGTYTI